MSKLAIRLSTLILCATALMVVPTVAPVKAKMEKAETGRKQTHIKKHSRHWRAHVSGGWQTQPVARPYSGEVCPGIARSFDCKIWPPPFEDDPDRKASKF